MSTDAFFFFHMDPDNRRAGPSNSPCSPSTSSQSSHFLVDYQPKPVTLTVAPTTTTTTAPSANTEAIHRWLAGQRPYAYLPDDAERSAFSESEEEEEEESNDDDDDASSSTSSDSEEDQIYLRPRRQHSAPSIALHVSAPACSSSSSIPRRAWPLTAPKPAMPVVDLSAATAFTTIQDKSYWSDDEEEEEEQDLPVIEHEDQWALEEDDDDLPALEEDTGAPASTSTRSLPIPIASRTRSNPILSRLDEQKQFDDEWRPSSPRLWEATYQSPIGRRAPAKAIQDGQSFYTPWIADYIAGQHH